MQFLYRIGATSLLKDGAAVVAFAACPVAAEVVIVTAVAAASAIAATVYRPCFIASVIVWRLRRLISPRCYRC